MKATGERNVLVESITKRVLDEMLGLRPLTLDQQAKVAGSVASGRVYVSAVKDRMNQMVPGASVELGMVPRQPAEMDMGKDQQCADFLGKAMEHAEDSQVVLQEANHPEAAVLALRLRLAQDALAADKYETTCYHLNRIFSTASMAAES
jgi:thioester reductase-like protein